MAGEIQRVRTKDGVEHIIDYRSLANRPDGDIATLKANVAAILAALEDAGISVDTSSASVDGDRLVLSGAAYSVSGNTLSVSGADTDGTKLVF